MKYISLLITGILFFSCTSKKQEIKYDPQIAPYVSFLKTQHMSSSDYIIDLFRKKDIVILSERLHPELTQYEMMLKFIKKKEFQEQVGHIFIETCGRYQENNIRKYLNEALSETESEKLLLHICRNNRYHSVWDYYNFYYFLKELRGINENLTRKIQVYPADLRVDWAILTKDNFVEEVQSKFENRDQRMAEYIIEKYDSIKLSSNERNKALVIMNYRHAFAHKFTETNNVGNFLMEEYGSNMANVMINSFTFTAYRSDIDFDIAPIQNGKWAAAFLAADKNDIGFSFQNNVFGKDYFDYWTYGKHQHSYSDVFDGFIFYNQICEQKMVFGIPNLIDESFFDELKRRDEIVNTQRADSVIWKMNELEDRIDLFCSDSLKYSIRKWLK